MTTSRKQTRFRALNSPQKREQWALKIEPPLKAKLERVAAANQTSMSQVIRSAIEQLPDPQK